MQRDIPFLQQYNDTRSAFGRVRDILYDQFSDTATTTKRVNYKVFIKIKLL